MYLTVLLNDGRFRERNIQTWFDYLLKKQEALYRETTLQSLCLSSFTYVSLITIYCQHAELVVIITPAYEANSNIIWKVSE